VDRWDIDGVSGNDANGRCWFEFSSGTGGDGWSATIESGRFIGSAVGGARLIVLPIPGGTLVFGCIKGDVTGAGAKSADVLFTREYLLLAALGTLKFGVVGCRAADCS
jgi:hypothetical protein